MTIKKLATAVGLSVAVTVGMFVAVGSASAATNDYLKTFYAADRAAAMSACNSYADYANRNWTNDRNSWSDWFYCADGAASSVNLWVSRP